MRKTPKKTNELETDSLLKIVLLALALAVLAFLPYVQTFDHDFVSYDDNEYVTENDMVRDGLSVEGVIWAFTTFHAANWHPLTWMSHMLDINICGLDPGWSHLVNAFLHALSTGLLFLALRSMTGAIGQSAFVAALFGVHPLHVESVAWLAERKDVLSGFFFMLVLLSYEKYARRGGTGRYLLVILFFFLGLLSKPMLVTVPFVLLLLDVWPLNRTSWARTSGSTDAKPLPWKKLLFEKAPLFALTIAVSAITYAAQRRGGAMVLMEQELIPLGARVANALVSYTVYLGKMVWPSSLAIIYPHPGRTLPAWKPAASSIFLIAVTTLVLRQKRDRPYLAVGWFWYLGMLVPVIGVVQVGMQAMADRYAYLPLIGIFIMITWYAAEFAPLTGALRKKVLVTVSGIVIALLITLSFFQVAWWSNSITLFQHAAAASPGNWKAQRLLANALSDKGLIDDAIAHYRESIRIQPRNALAHNNLAVELVRLGKREEAVEHYREALRIRPEFAEASNNLGNALAILGRRDEAIEQYRRAIALRPGWKVPQGNLDLILRESTLKEAGRENPDRGR